MKIKVDENLPTEVARVLQDAGHDASTVLEQGLGGASDEALINRAKSESRVLITLDVGFGDIRRYPPGEHVGIIVLRLVRHDVAHLEGTAHRLVELLESELVEGKLWIVSEERVRIRE